MIMGKEGEGESEEGPGVVKEDQNGGEGGTRPHQLLTLTLAGKKTERPRLGKPDAQTRPARAKSSSEIHLDRLHGRSGADAETAGALSTVQSTGPRSSKAGGAAAKSHASHHHHHHHPSERPPRSSKHRQVVHLVHTESPPPTTTTSATIATIEEEAAEDRRKMKLALIWVVISFIGMGLYTMHAVDRIRLTRRQHHEEKMQVAVGMFPTNPYEYNRRQRLSYAKNMWRRFNFRSIAILCVSTVASLFVAHWHRQRRAMLQKRKTVAFWLWTAIAGIVSLAWGMYIFKQSRQPIVIKQIKRNPYLRAFLYLGSIAVAGLGLYAYRLSKRKPRKQRILEEWRKRKEKQTMKKAQDIRYQDIKPFKMDPLGKTPAGSHPYKPTPYDPKEFQQTPK